MDTNNSGIKGRNTISRTDSAGSVLQMASLNSMKENHNLLKHFLSEHSLQLLRQSMSNIFTVLFSAFYFVNHNLSFDKSRGHQSQYELNLMKVFAMNH